MIVNHSLEPFYTKDSKVLILGSMPSVTSRKLGFYYAHPQNLFWKTLQAVYQEKIGSSKEEKIAFLKKHQIALFDVLKSCDISNSSDASIQNPVCNDLLPILQKSKIKTIFTTGKKAETLYKKYIYPSTKIKAIPLPSTSPLYCPKGVDEKLKEAYEQIRKFTG